MSAHTEKPTSAFENYLMTVSKIGIPVVFCIIILGWLLYALFPDFKEALKSLNNQNNQCFTTIRDLSNSVQKLTERVENMDICEQKGK